MLPREFLCASPRGTVHSASLAEARNHKSPTPRNFSLPISGHYELRSDSIAAGIAGHVTSRKGFGGRTCRS